MILETERLSLREMCEDDFSSLCAILQDEEVMYAYEHAFSDEEAWQWLHRQQQRYQSCGFGLWAVLLKDTGKMIGQCGLSLQDFNGKEVLEVGYLFQKQYWHCGYAAEAAIACKEYAFHTLNAPAVFSIIRDNNLASQKVALRNGMKPVGSFVKNYYNVDMPHIVYSVENPGMA